VTRDLSRAISSAATGQELDRATPHIGSGSASRWARRIANAFVFKMYPNRTFVGPVAVPRQASSTNAIFSPSAGAGRLSTVSALDRGPLICSPFADRHFNGAAAARCASSTPRP